MSMPREAKPDWNAIPESVRRELAEIAGSVPADADIVWGSYSPSVSLRVVLVDGRSVFVKGSYPGQDQFGVTANRREVEVLESLPLLSRVAPHFLGCVDRDCWFLSVFECLTPVRSVLPWTPEKVSAVLERLSLLHHLYPERSRVPALIHDAAEDPLCGVVLRGEDGWCQLDADGWQQILSLPDQAGQEWLLLNRNRLELDDIRAMALPDQQRLLHMDLRSDNILFDEERGCVLLDWPFVCWGPVGFDLVYFLLTVEAEGGQPVEQYLPLLRDGLDYALPEENWRCLLANAAGFFAAHCIKPEVAAMPRLRSWQKQSFLTALAALQRLG